MEDHMTKQRLEQYSKLRKEISALEDKIYDLEANSGEYVSDVVKDYRSGYPKSLVISGYGSSRIPRLRARMAAKIAECNEIEVYIDSIEDSLMWQMLTYRYIEGLTLIETADRIGYSTSYIAYLLGEFFKTP